MADPAFYEIVLVPKISVPENPDAKLAAFAEKIRALRLRSLQTDPTAFARTYDEELGWGLDKTFERLSDVAATQFLAVKKASGEPTPADFEAKIESLLEDEWLGHVVILGPQEDDGSNPRDFPRNDFPCRDAEGNVIPPKALIFRIGGTYVCPAGRGLGLGLKLMRATLEKATADAQTWNVPFRVTLAAFGDNIAAIRMYEKAGFQVVERRQSRHRQGMSVTVMHWSGAAES